jgi:mannose-6-phosphate isomerase-like protein (cupin superfamily)
MTYPRTIDDGHGSRTTFLGVEDDRLLLASSVAPGAGPPMHVHHLQTETVRVQSGRIGVQLEDGPEVLAGPGEEFTFAPGVAHRFWNAGDDELLITGEASPPGNLEYFLSAVYASTAANGGRPGPWDAAFLMTRFRSEFALTIIPAPVRRFVFPVQARIGRLLSRYRHYADAPAPVRTIGSGLPSRG